MADDKEPQEDKQPQGKPTPPPFRLTRQRKEELLRLLKEALVADKEFIAKVWKQMRVWLLAAASAYGLTVCFLAIQAHNRVTKQIDTTETSLSNRVVASSMEISNLILRTFESSNVTMIVRSVATERASHILETQVAPAVAKLTNDIATFSHRIEGQQWKIDELNTSLLKAHETESNLVTLIDDANKALKQLKDDSEFITTVVRADHDDRKAFDKIYYWSQKIDSPFRAAALSVYIGIQTELFKSDTAWQEVTWARYAPLTNQATWKIEQINHLWNLIPPSQAFDYLAFVWGNTNITKEQKLSFLRNTYLTDSRNSIHAAHRAAVLVATEFNIRYNPPMFFEPVEKAWKAFVATNRLFAASTNTTTNTVYELFLASDTNRVRVIRDWNDTKLFSFKTEFVPKEGTLNTLYFHSSANSISPIDKGEISRFKNVYWATFGGMDTNTVLKVELKYEKDTSTTPVQSMEVTKNSIIFDRTNTFTIPLP